MSAADILPLLNQILGRLGALEATVANASHSGPGAGGGGSSSPSSASSSETEEVPRSIRAFDEYTSSSLTPFVTACSELGGDAASLGRLVSESFAEMRSFLLMASACKAPADSELGPLMTPLGEKNRAISALTQRNEWEKHCKTVSEGMAAVSWLCVKPAPRDYVQSALEGGEYWANNIRKGMFAVLVVCVCVCICVCVCLFVCLFVCLVLLSLHVAFCCHTHKHSYTHTWITNRISSNIAYANGLL